MNGHGHTVIAGVLTKNKEDVGADAPERDASLAASVQVPAVERAALVELSRGFELHLRGVR